MTINTSLVDSIVTLLREYPDGLNPTVFLQLMKQEVYVEQEILNTFWLLIGRGTIDLGQHLEILLREDLCGN